MNRKVIRIQRPLNDNEDNIKKLEHMRLVAFYLENREKIQALWDSFDDAEKALWLNS